MTVNRSRRRLGLLAALALILGATSMFVSAPLAMGRAAAAEEGVEA
jgi:hypothetical protein